MALNLGAEIEIQLVVDNAPELRIDASGIALPDGRGAIIAILRRVGCGRTPTVWRISNDRPWRPRVFRLTAAFFLFRSRMQRVNKWAHRLIARRFRCDCPRNVFSSTVATERKRLKSKRFTSTVIWRMWSNIGGPM
ncbi:MAG: hypothetical protein AAGJ87_10590 [Pseudomonadota bacterium]